MVAVVSGRESHVGDVFHVGRPFVALVHVLLIVGPHGPLRPFLSSGRLAVYTPLPLVEIVDHVVVVILSGGRNRTWRILLNRGIISGPRK